MLWGNVLNVGVIGGVMIGNGRSDVFFGLILVHGMLELTCVFVAAGVGLRVAWAWIAPGPVPHPHPVAGHGRPVGDGGRARPGRPAVVSAAWWRRS